MPIYLKYFIFNFLIIITFTSCTQNIYKVFDTKIYTDTFNNLFDESKTYQDTLQFTQKADVINEKNDVEAILNVTYLNSTSKEWDNSKIHSFIVGIYIANGNVADYKLKINGLDTYKKIKITKEMNILGSIPMENKWADYYLIQISKYDTYQNNKDYLILKLDNNKYKSTEVKFITQ